MTDEQPTDLRSLEVSEPEVIRTSIRRFRRRVLILIVWGSLFAASAAAIVAATIHNRHESIEARIAAAPALNSEIGDYRVGGVDVGLLKVVRLSGDQIGMQFVFHSSAPLGDCCNLFPRDALPRTTLRPGNAHFAESFVVLSDYSDMMSNGTLNMLLTNGDPNAPARLGRFTVDLNALHVEGIGGLG